ncbi:PLAC8 family-domain-containing protein [Russula earlei]|uniref:PLAC8 family-domain-containing protein n=1 Tax=Russula earlei TaxID=71964 RepID=A0ACC0UBQ6_9AGAM|nr:PLAC8 family-domain-containing protein [Russula earlei]
MVGGNRNARDLAIGVDGQRYWSYGLFECFLHCWAVFCPCDVHARTKRRFIHIENYGVPLQGEINPFNEDCCVYYCLYYSAHWNPPQMTFGRGNVRRRYGIRGHPTDDFLASFFCRPCALAQERREVELEENSLRVRN